MTAKEQEGYELAKGALLYIARVGLITWLFIFVANKACVWFGLGMDDSDIDSRHRSGLRIHTDARTGVQYLSDGRGGLVRREEVYPRPAPYISQ